MTRPAIGASVVDPLNRTVIVTSYGTDASGEYVEVRLSGSYGAHVRLPVSCIRTQSNNADRNRR